MNELIKNKGHYHGQYIETEGYFHFAFEECAIYYNNYGIYNGNLLTIRSIHGLWIDFAYNLPIEVKGLDSLQDKFIRVKGFFDTTKTGHLGEYDATLVNTYSISPVYTSP